MRQLLGLAAISCLLASCVDEPTPKEAETAAAKVENEASKTAVEKRQLSIEQAAEEATKLIEADAKSEIDAATPGDSVN
jgi:ABC-type uncharacterized transport system auxiliary subunit